MYAGSTGTPTSADRRSVSPGQLRGATGGDDAEQRRRAGLVAVVVDRAADLVEQHRQRAVDRRARPGDQLVVALVRRAELALQRLGGLGRQVELRRDRVGELAATGAEHAHEARDADLVHRDRGDAAAERHDAFGAGGSRRASTPPAAPVDRRRPRTDERELAPGGERADERERDEVDRRDLQAAGLDRGDEAQHRRFLHRGEQHAACVGSPPSPGARGPEDREVEHRVVERDRDELGRPGTATRSRARRASSPASRSGGRRRAGSRARARTGAFFRPTSARRRPTASVTAASSATSPSRIVSRRSAT